MRLKTIVTTLIISLFMAFEAVSPGYIETCNR